MSGGICRRGISRGEMSYTRFSYHYIIAIAPATATCIRQMQFVLNAVFVVDVIINVYYVFG